MAKFTNYCSPDAGAVNDSSSWTWVVDPANIYNGAFYQNNGFYHIIVFAKSSIIDVANDVSTNLCWYPLKTLEKNLWFSDVFRGYGKRPVAWNRYVKWSNAAAQIGKSLF